MERGTVKYLVVFIFLVAICGIVLYPLFDLIYYKLIIKSEFVYSVNGHIIQPIIFACVFGTTYWLIDKRRK